MGITNSLLSAVVIIGTVACCSCEPNVNKQAVPEFPNTSGVMEIASEPSPIITVASNAPYVTRDEKLELVKLLYLEAGVQSRECKEMVAAVVMNRLNSGKWGNTLHEVIFAEGPQFDCAYMIPNIEPFVCKEAPYYERSAEFIGNWKDCYSIVDVVTSRGIQIPPYVLYFSSGAPFDWEGYKVYMVIDGMYFGYLEEDVK